MINTLEHVILVGDRVLLKPRSASQRTSGGLYLPPSVAEKEVVQSGYVIKVGPGYAIPATDEDAAWKGTAEEAKYVPLQAKEGDLALYLQKSAIEIEIDDEKYVIVHQSAILMLVRDPKLFE